MFLITTLTFVLIHLAPGDPITLALEGPTVPESVRDHWRRSFGLDRPLPEQYGRWLTSVARGELGYSITHRRPVRAVLFEALPRTLLLAGTALVLSFALGIVVGVLQAERPGGARDRWLGRLLLALYSVPDFWLALLLLVLFAYRIPLFPAGGITDPVMYDYYTVGERVADRIRHLVLPVLTLTLLSTAVIARHQRSALLAVLPSDWMRTALAKGVSWTRAVRRHALRNALLPTVTLAGLSLPTLAAGALFVEKVFSWPGMGLLTINAIGARDHALVTAGVLVFSVLVAAGALLADVAAAIIDPRIRIDG